MNAEVVQRQEHAVPTAGGGSIPTPPLHVQPITARESAPFIIAHHYSGRAANASFAFGLFAADKLVGVVTFGRPSSPQVARSVAPNNRDIVWELNRLAITTHEKNAASRLIGRALRLLPRPFICVSFADRGQAHVGFVYQATNFWFAGESRPHDSEYLIDGKRVHPRTLAARGITSPRQWARENGVQFVPIEPKYRYVYLNGVEPSDILWSLSRQYPKATPVHLNRNLDLIGA
jgi:hypothetical protein